MAKRYKWQMFRDILGNFLGDLRDRKLVLDNIRLYDYYLRIYDRFLEKEAKSRRNLSLKEAL